MRRLALIPLVLLLALANSAGAGGGAGTLITVTQGTWVCNQPLASYGPLPITVETTIPNLPQDNLNGDVRLLSSCAGDGTPATDLILHVNGNGGSLGSGDDGMVLVGAHDIEIEGYLNCGQPQGGAHQDGVQMNSAHRLTFRGFTSGDWNTLTATCHGAGGVWYVSQLNDNNALLQDVVCDGCRMVGSTTGNFGTAFHMGASTNSGARDSCFAARIPLGHSASPIGPIDAGNTYVDLDSPGAGACGAPEPPPPPPPPVPPPPPPPPYAPACEPTCDEQIAALTAERDTARGERDEARAERDAANAKVAEWRAWHGTAPE